ncbi:unnamed protein product [Orchesella dallaii]|uniref:Long-chain-fatty-acid--CoA ligase n=1 Tax=Orchesella dallaii TaxID=48710 RepID=A0ABP1PPA3_9HEXA
MSGDGKENVQIAKYYLQGILHSFLDTTFKNKKFLPFLLVGVSNQFYKLDDASSWLHDGILSLQFLLKSMTSAVIFGLSALVLVNYNTIYYILKALPRDVRGLIRFSKVLRSIRWADRNNFTVAKCLDRNAEKFPDKICFYFEEQKWTFRQVQELSNRIGNHFSSIGFKKGDTVALFMENRPEYVCIWLGLNKIGVTAALVNYNLRLQSLLHCIETVKAKAVIFGIELTSAMQEITEVENLLSTIPMFCSGHGNNALSKGVRDFDAEVAAASPATPPELNDMKLQDSLYYFYTSGTTGMPKAAVIKQYRFMMAANGVHYLNCVTKDDIIYDSLPLYHMTGGMVGVGQTLVFGSSLVIRKKFSATQFWKDCIKYNVTVAQYLGETCRYLLAQPPSPEDTAHKVRLMSGNGLRHEIWADFAKRFNIPEIGEVYGSTEGNANLTNIDSTTGAVGFVPRFLYSVLPTALIKVDKHTGEPIRDPKTGLCIRCKPNEPGELMAKIVEKHPIRDFQGYTDDKSTSKKIVRDVFAKGDSVFRSGDILVMDNLCYFYFKDRTGDTYRWKGENVSTAEVGALISSFTSHKDAVVYGVKVPNTEGRAGMLAIVDPTGSVDLERLATGISRNLPPYARPIFLRFLDEVDMTGTYKLKKFRLQDEGYDVTKIKDKMYFLQSGKFQILDETLMKQIDSGEIRL